jgi:hypothetical protein
VTSPAGDMDREFERQKLCYEQNCEQMRSLNQIMWQVPIIAMTLTGGLWYGVATLSAAQTGIRIRPPQHGRCQERDSCEFERSGQRDT